MGRIEKSIDIQVSPEKIWEMLALDRYLEWEGFVIIGVKYTSEVCLPPDKYHLSSPVHGVKKHKGFDLEVAECFENTKIMYRSKDPFSQWGNIYMIVTYTLTPTETGTRLTLRLDCSLSRGILGKIIDVIYQKIRERDTARQLKKLKVLLEE
ncbi:MAG: SRPBCC family protein [Candidatus Bathyarchaeota archaeon]